MWSHLRRHLGQTPPVSKVFQEWPHRQFHRSSARGLHPHRGQRIPLSPPPESPAWTSGAVSGRFSTTNEVRFMQVRPLQLSGMIAENSSGHTRACPEPAEGFGLRRSTNWRGEAITRGLKGVCGNSGRMACKKLVGRTVYNKSSKLASLRDGASQQVSALIQFSRRHESPW